MSLKPQEQGTAAPVTDEDAMSAALQEIRANRNEPEQPAAQAAAVAEPKTEATPADTESKPAVEAKAADAPAPAAEETPEAKLAKMQAELHRVTSEIGRVSALNRKAMAQDVEIGQLRQQLAEKTAPPKTEAEARSKLADLAEQVKDFPELLSVVQGVAAALQEVEAKAQSSAKQAAQEAIKPLEPLRQQHLDRQASEQEAANAADLRTFSGTYPTAGEVIKTDDFKTWLPKQSQAIQWAFFKGETPADALPVMDAYDAHLRRSGKQSIASAPQQSTQQPASADTSKPDTRLARASGIPSRASTGGKGSLPPADDFDGSFEFFRKQRLAKAAAQA